MAVLTIKLFCFLSAISSILATKPPPSFDMDDQMGTVEKYKIMYLSDDLFKESLLKMRQILPIKREHEVMVSYNIGMLMGRIREKYRFMSETYRDIVDSYNNASWIRPPGVRYYRPLHFIIALERMHYLGLEIDKLVDVMVDEATDDLKLNQSIVGQKERQRRKRTTPTESSLAYNVNMTTNSDKLQPQKDIAREQAEKSLMRQRYLMKKLGNPANMTTAKKRFLRHWPVEDSWSLDKYYHDYK